ncbi:hypothetical protein C8R44DRAFT_739121 [Mycena epipterygia]|nr:hypothetical protein C8R44DRAFT_739121 [Mycena epipterygia]
MAPFHQVFGQLIWGRTHEELPISGPFSTFEQREILIDELARRPLWTALGLADMLLPAFRSESISPASAVESKASRLIPPEQTLQFVVRDLEWMEDLESLAREKWGLLDDTITAGVHPKWTAQSVALAHRAESLRESLKHGMDGVCVEGCEDDTDQRAKEEPKLLNPLYRLVGPDNQATPSFTASGQRSTKLEGGGTAKPDVTIYFSTPNGTTQTLLREVNKTALVQVAHVFGLDRHINTARIGWPPDIAGIYTQAYSASFTRENPRDPPPSNTVQVGNPSLWAMGYTVSGTLVLSKWYSSNPKQMMDCLERQNTLITIHQGHLLRQKMALTVLDPMFFQARTAHRSKPTRLAIAVDSVVRMMGSVVDVFARLGEMIFRTTTRDFDLDGACVHVRIKTSTPEFLQSIEEKHTFKTVEAVKLWTDGQWFVKIPTGHQEIVATHDISQNTTVVEFGADMVVSTGAHKGKVLLATRAAGEPAGPSEGSLHDLDAETKDGVKNALMSIHEAGWHHHDIHPANIVVRDGKTTVIDYGEAMLGVDCRTVNASCPDADAIAAMSISPSSSTEIAHDSESPSEMAGSVDTLAGSVDDKK